MSTFTYDFARRAGPSALMSKIESGAESLAAAISALDLQQLDISHYTRRYVDDYRVLLVPTFQLHAHLLALALADGPDDLREAVLVDYGGGSGLLSLLARAAGVGTVVYTDIYDVACRDARVLGEAIGCEADSYLVGDVGELLAHLDQRELEATAVASYDVIEHVYDIEAFFATLPRASTGPLTLVMASSANAAHPLVRRRTMRFQRQVELTARPGEWGHKERDSLQPYRAIRRQIVLDRLALRGIAADPTAVERLAAATRGLANADVQSAVDRFAESAGYPPEPDHPTNTCDPHTGNWAEHLMDPFALASLLEREGFAVRVDGGYYGTANAFPKREAGRLLNAGIRMLGPRSLNIAPYYAIVARRAGSPGLGSARPNERRAGGRKGTAP
jgi:2-polyprenyl-3-methyl-5-hydroxy-6-metoxy-1,4-benzoquinol methylase